MKRRRSLLFIGIIFFVAFIAYASETRLLTSQVTYWNLAPEVGLKLNVSKDIVGSKVEFKIIDPLADKTYAAQTAKVDADGIAKVEIKIKAPEMMGLLAIAELKDEDGKVLKFQRPFDVTDNSRRSFRYGATSFGNCHIAKDRKFPWKRMEESTPTVEESFQSLYDCYQNVVNILLHNDRGHFTPWEELGETSWNWYLYGSDAMTVDYKKTKELCRLCDQAGILTQTHIDFQYGGQSIIKEGHPWIEMNTNGGAEREPTLPPVCVKWIDGQEQGVRLKLNPGYHCWFMKRNNPDWHRPLTEEEKKLSNIDFHSATNWIEHMIREMKVIQQEFNFGSFWLDNFSNRDVAAPYILPEIRSAMKKRRPEFVFMSNDLGRVNRGFTDVFWIERAPRTPLIEQFKSNRELLNKPRDPGVTFCWAGNHPQSDGMTLNDINNQKEYTFLYRQFLFEMLAMDADMIDAGNEPRRHDVRWVRFKDAYKDHQHSWGFQTLYNHLYNSEDITSLYTSRLVKVLNAPMSVDDKPAENTIHVRLMNRPTNGQMIVHLFNFTGTTTEPLKKRAMPILQEKLEFELRVPVSGIYNVKAISPDFPEFDDVRKYQLETDENKKLKISIPLDLYTMVVVDAGYH